MERPAGDLGLDQFYLLGVLMLIEIDFIPAWDFTLLGAKPPMLGIVDAKSQRVLLDKMSAKIPNEINKSASATVVLKVWRLPAQFSDFNDWS